MEGDKPKMSPEGTIELSPGRQSWVDRQKRIQSRQGRLNLVRLFSAVPDGTVQVSILPQD